VQFWIVKSLDLYVFIWILFRVFWRMSNSRQISIGGDRLALKMTLGRSVHRATSAYVSVEALQISIRLTNNTNDAASDRNDPRVSSHLHLPLSPIVSANFAHRPNVRLGFPRFGKLAIPIVQPRISQHSRSSTGDPDKRGVSIFQYKCRARDVSPLKVK